jgi:CheY-like chemotaxis protein
MLSFRPEVVLLDLEMPGMNGHEFMAWMVEQNVQIPVIIASCNDDAAADFATAATLSKPYDLDQLLKAVTAIVPSPRDKS